MRIQEIDTPTYTINLIFQSSAGRYVTRQDTHVLELNPYSGRLEAPYIHGHHARLLVHGPAQLVDDYTIISGWAGLMGVPTSSVAFAYTTLSAAEVREWRETLSVKWRMERLRAPDPLDA